MRKRRPCSECRRWFAPHPRVGARQVTCGAAACQRHRHRRADRHWHRRHPDSDRGRRLQAPPSASARARSGSRRRPGARLALLGALPDALPARVRAGAIPPQAAMQYLVPLARANRRHCERLLAALGETRLSVREVGALYAGYRRADPAGRERLVADPQLFLRTQREPRRPTSCTAATRAWRWAKTWRPCAGSHGAPPSASARARSGPRRRPRRTALGGRVAGGRGRVRRAPRGDAGGLARCSIRRPGRRFSACVTRATARAGSRAPSASPAAPSRTCWRAAPPRCRAWSAPSRGRRTAPGSWSSPRPARATWSACMRSWAPRARRSRTPR